MDTYEEHVYYVRRCQGCSPIAAVAIGCKNGIYARGIAICSYDEQFARKEGRRGAIARLDKAFGVMSSGDPIGLPIPHKGVRPVSTEFKEQWFLDFNTQIDYKSGYDVEPTEFEQYMFSKSRQDYEHVSISG
jgi:hypothetical protein